VSAREILLLTSSGDINNELREMGVKVSDRTVRHRSKKNATCIMIHNALNAKTGFEYLDKKSSTDMSRKVVGLLPSCPSPPFFGGGRSWVPSNTLSPGTNPTSIPSGILIHLAVWPHHTWAENWWLCPFLEGELGPHLTQYGLCRGQRPY